MPTLEGVFSSTDKASIHRYLIIMWNMQRHAHRAQDRNKWSWDNFQHTQVLKKSTHWDLHPGIQVQNLARYPLHYVCWCTLVDLGTIHSTLKCKKYCTHCELDPGIQVQNQACYPLNYVYWCRLVQLGTIERGLVASCLNPMCARTWPNVQMERNWTQWVHTCSTSSMSSPLSKWTKLAKGYYVSSTSSIIRKCWDCT